MASYGRRKGRRLRVTKQGLFDTLLPRLTIDLPGSGGIDPASLFKHKKEKLWLEIGFGGGEHLAHQASHHHSEVNIIGCEPYMNGTAGLLKHIDDHKIDNVRVFTEDVRLLMQRLPDECLSRVFILYPDPWPKVRHHKRRLVSTEFLDSVARLMPKGAVLQLATDDYDYCIWMLERLLAHPQFSWLAKSPKDWLVPPSDWISTKYEQRGIGLGSVPTYLLFVKK